MKYLLLNCLVLCCLHLVAQQSDIVGVVSIHNSEINTGKRQYVANAQVEPKFRKANATTTNNHGEFKLIYVEVPEKATVYFLVKKEGLKVISPTTLSAVAGQHEVVRISMAHPDSAEKNILELFNINKTKAEERLEAEVKQKNKEITSLRKSEAAKINRLTEELLKLEERRKTIQEQAQELANRYASINVDDASPIFKEAFSLFENGDLDSALLILTRVNLANTIYQILQERQKLTELQNERVIRDSIQRQRSTDVAEARQFKADLHKTLFEFDSASLCYELLIKLDSVNERYLFSYANFLGWLNQHEKAISYYSKVLEIYSNYLKVDAETYEPHVAITQNNLGILYKGKRDCLRAEEAYKEALKIYKRLAKVTPHVYEPDLAMTQNNLGILYKSKRDFVRAKEAYQEALEIYKRLAKVTPQTYEPHLAATQNNLGILYKSKRDFVRAKEAYQEALEIYKRLAKVTPQTYEPHLAATQYNLGILYLNQNAFVRAEDAYQEALRIYKRLENVNPQSYDPYIAKTQNNLASLYSEKKDFIKAEAASLEALEIYKRLFKATQQASEANLGQQLANCYGNGSWYLLFTLKFKEAEEAAKSGLALESSYTWIKTNLAHSLLFQAKYEDALKVYQELKLLKNEPGKWYAAICLEDLDELEKSGITNRDINKIRAFLKDSR